MLLTQRRLKSFVYQNKSNESKNRNLKTVLATKQAIKLKRHSILSIKLKQEDFKVHMHKNYSDFFFV